MDKKIILSIITGTLLIFPVVANAEQNVKEPKTITSSYDEDVPTWAEGDSWTYNVDFTGNALDLFEFEWGFRNLKLSVDQETSSSYKMKINGDVTGEITAGIVKGTLRDTTITGDATYAKSNIGISELDVHISGDIQLIFSKSFAIDLTLSLNPAYNPIEWPLSVGKQWNLPVSNMEGFLDFTYDGELIFDDLAIPNVLGGQPAKCAGVEAKAVEAGTFDAYKIECIYDEIEFYYASAAGNTINLHAITEDFTLNMDLKEYTYGGGTSGAPNKPNKPSGPTSGKADETFEYSSSTTDNEGDQLYYLFNWGDGTDSGWLGPKNSGEACKASHKWTSQGSFEVKVKAKDTEEHVSVWSDSLTVSISKSRSTGSYLTRFLENLIEKFPRIARLLECPFFEKLLNLQ